MNPLNKTIIPTWGQLGAIGLVGYLLESFKF